MIKCRQDKASIALDQVKCSYLDDKMSTKESFCCFRPTEMFLLRI
jgi:hypothetical protein